MKKHTLRFVFLLILISVMSCDEPETVVTNYIHQDGSVTRRIEMVNHKKRFKNCRPQVPFDDTWTVHDSLNISQKGDTTWYKTAEKLFRNTEEINLSYRSDTSINKGIYRQAAFRKSFKWFNTELRFSEKIEKKMISGYPVSDFMNREELLYFYSPESLKYEKERGADSLRYRALADSVKKKTDFWNAKCVVSEWIMEFTKLIAGKAGSDLTNDSLKSRENEFVKIIENNSKFDSLWSNGVILKKFVGDSNASRFKSEADSAMEKVFKDYFFDFNDYSVRMVMPGKLIGTNGFIDSSRILLWPVKSDFFLTESYEMWAESKITNTWAWVASGIFILFVLTGLIIKVIKKD